MLEKTSLSWNQNLVDSLLFGSDVAHRESKENWLDPCFQRTLKWAWHGMFISFHLRVWTDHSCQVRVHGRAYSPTIIIRLLPGTTGETLSSYIRTMQ